MINSLPRWVWPGAGLLAFLAGMINVTGVLGFTHEAVTHLTGVTTYLGAALAGGKASNVLHLGGILLAFVAGASLCGLLLGVGGMKPGARYHVVLWVESIMLAAAVPLLEHQFIAGVFLTCAATGLQNALVAAFSGSLIRTTHLSGLFTDLGILIGQALRGLPTDARRWKLCFSVISGFLGGAVAGAACFHEWSYHTLLIPAGVTALLGMIGSLRRVGHRTSE
ncbi:MAG: YoaK family protein [Verrucomicrobiota bacterium]